MDDTIEGAREGDDPLSWSHKSGLFMAVSGTLVLMEFATRCADHFNGFKQLRHWAEQYSPWQAEVWIEVPSIMAKLRIA